MSVKFQLLKIDTCECKQNMANSKNCDRSNPPPTYYQNPAGINTFLQCKLARQIKGL